MGKRDVQIVVTPLLMDRRTMAAAICLSEDTLDSLRRRGCPSVTVPGTTKRLFNPSKVVEWIEAEGVANRPASIRESKEQADRKFGT